VAVSTLQVIENKSDSTHADQGLGLVAPQSGVSWRVLLVKLPAASGVLVENLTLSLEPNHQSSASPAHALKEGHE